MTIDPDSFTPVYHQLADLLRAKIDCGELGPGTMLPSELQLMQDYGIGRVAVRQAIALLRSEGRIVTTRRIGSYVRGDATRTSVKVEGPAEVIARMPSPQERRKLGVPEGVPVFAINRPGMDPELLPADRTSLVVEGQSGGD